jgi:hypothetical protein
LSIAYCQVDKPELLYSNGASQQKLHQGFNSWLTKFTCKSYIIFLPFISKTKINYYEKMVNRLPCRSYSRFLMAVPFMDDTPAEKEILNTLSASLKEDGVYMLPTAPPDATMEEHQKIVSGMEGKPWATVIYRTSYEMDMVMPLVRGFLIDLVLVFLLIYIITRAGTPTAMRVFAASIALGLFTFLVGPYTMHNWFQTPTESYIGHFIDGFVAWGLCGLWLGWWLNRK